MRAKINVYIFIAVFLYAGTSFAGNWANSYGSCYGKWSKNISVGMSVLYLGPFVGFDLGFHDCISGGVATGYNVRFFSPTWNYNQVPIVVRAAFHPFNLNALSEKINVRNKLDVYVGLSTGWRVGWASYRKSGSAPSSPSVGGFFVREYIGIRFFPKDNFYLLAEEGSGLGVFNLGVGFKF